MIPLRNYNEASHHAQLHAIEAATDNTDGVLPGMTCMLEVLQGFLKRISKRLYIQTIYIYIYLFIYIYINVYIYICIYIYIVYIFIYTHTYVRMYTCICICARTRPSICICIYICIYYISMDIRVLQGFRVLRLRLCWQHSCERGLAPRTLESLRPSTTITASKQ